MNEKLKTAVPALLSGICLLTALLLPLAFRKAELADNGQMSADERVSMFLGYMDGDGSVQVLTLTEVGEDMVADCEARFEDLVDIWNPDRAAEWGEITGSEYLSLESGDGKMKLCRMWLESKGDWHCWMDVFFNAETGELYYLYTNSVCLFHRGDYSSAFGGGLDEEKCAGLAADYGRESVKMFSGNHDGPSSAIFTRNGDLICREIECTYYTSTFFEVEMRVK